MTINYSINGVLFTSLSVLVSESEGIIDGLVLKDPLTVDWPDAHGQVADLDRPRYEARQIKLDCFLIGASATDFLGKVNALQTQFLKPGTQRLMLSPIAGKPLVYEVYLSGGIKLEKKWRDAQMVGKFTLTLIEPQPVKWVLSGAGGSTVSLHVTALSPVSFHWGDGSKTVVQGSSQTVSHTYGGSNTATYYLIVSGELERLTLLDPPTNLTELWPRLY